MSCIVQFAKKPFSNKGNLNRHMKQAHGQELPKDYQAPIQGKPLKQGTPTKNAKQQAISKISSPKPKLGINKLPPAMQNIQRPPYLNFDQVLILRLDHNNHELTSYHIQTI